MTTTFTPGDVSASQTLTDSDHLYPGHINELRTAVNGLEDTSVFNVEDYGAVGDGTTDSSSYIQAAINAANIAGGVVHFPSGSYLISTTLNIGTASNTAISMQGDGMVSSLIYTNNGTADMFKVYSDYGGNFYDLRLDTTVTRTGGYGIQYMGGTVTSMNGYTNIQRCYMNNQYGAISMQKNYGFTVSDNHLIGCKSVGIRVANETTPDQGDGAIYNNYIEGPHDNTGACISQTSSGGCRIFSNKLQYGATGYIFDCLDGNTVDILFTNNSIENQTGNGIYIARSSGTYGLSNILINDNQLTSSSMAYGISVPDPGYSGLNIQNNLISGPGSGVASYAITIAHNSIGMISNNMIIAWQNGISLGTGVSNTYYGPNGYFSVGTTVANSGGTTNGPYTTKMTE